MKKLEIFNSMLEEQIAFFTKEAAKHKNLYRSCRYSVSILSALSAVLAALTVVLDDDLIKVLIVVASAVSSVIAFREGLRKPYELWMNERSTSHALLDLKRDARFYLTDNSSDEDIEDFFQKMQSIVTMSGKNWRAVVSSDSKATK